MRLSAEHLDAARSALLNWQVFARPGPVVGRKRRIKMLFSVCSGIWTVEPGVEDQIEQVFSDGVQEIDYAGVELDVHVHAVPCLRLHRFDDGATPMAADILEFDRG